MRKLKSLVCGSKFGQFYIDAISKMKECVEFIGIFSNGREVCNETFLKMEEWKEVFWGCGISERELVVVPSDTNNEAERQLRNYKRKQKQVVSFRSNQSHDYLCKSMSMLVVMRQNESNLFDRVSRILD